MTIKSILVAASTLMLGACAVPPGLPFEVPPERQASPATQNGLDASMLLNELARVASLSPEQRRRELAGLESERRFDDTKRFQLAALLEREDNAEALERGLKSLGAITEIDSRARPLLELMKKSLKARIELRQQTARTQELQDKLDQIKALEKSLQQRNEPTKTP